MILPHDVDSPEPPATETLVDQPSHRVIAAVADAAGVDPLELDPLFDAVDPDALDRLFRDAGRQCRLVFEYAGFEVEVAGEGAVRVRDPVDLSYRG